MCKVQHRMIELCLKDSLVKVGLILTENIIEVQ